MPKQWIVFWQEFLATKWKASYMKYYLRDRLSCQKMKPAGIEGKSFCPDSHIHWQMGEGGRTIPWTKLNIFHVKQQWAVYPSEKSKDLCYCIRVVIFTQGNARIMARKKDCDRDGKKWKRSRSFLFAITINSWSWKKVI